MTLSVEKALKHRLVMLSGDEDGLRRRAMKELVAAVAPDEGFDLDAFDAGESMPADWLAAAGTAPFLAERRVALVRNLCRRDETNGIEAAANLPESALVVLVADEESGDEDKLKRMATRRKAWEKAVAAAGGMVASFSTDSKQIGDQIRQEAARLEKGINPTAVELLVQMTSGSLTRCTEELEKLALYVGDAKEIRRDDVLAVTVPSREWSVFTLVDAVLAGRSHEALRQLRILVGQSSKAEEAAFRNILPQLSRNFKLIWQARICLDAGISDPSHASHSVLAAFPERPNLAKEKPWTQKKAMTSAKGVRYDQLAVALQLLADADARLKGQLPGFSGIETLERLVLDLVVALGRS